MNLAEELETREMTEDDRPYVVSSWVQSYAVNGWDSKVYEPKPVAGRPWTVPREFYEDYNPVILSLIKRSRVIVAGLRGIADSIVGWFAMEGDVLHYLLVKPRFRRLGIAKWLVGDAVNQPVIYTHRVKSMDSVRDAQGVRAPLIKVPEAWSYRRFRIWPQEAAA